MTRIPLPVLAMDRPLVECTDCGRCCTYVGVGINPPTSPRHATDVLWYLYHHGVYVYVDGEQRVVRALRGALPQPRPRPPVRRSTPTGRTSAAPSTTAPAR